MSVKWSFAPHRRVRCLCWLLALSSIPVAGNADAQAPSNSSADGARARVDELMARGIQSREAGHDTEALDFYRQALAIEPENPRVLAHLGATYHALGRWVSAHTYLAQALQYVGDSYIQRHRGELEEAMSTVADHIGFLEVYGAPAGAEALLNGQLVAGLPMSAPVPVVVGSYLLEVRLKGHYTLGRPIAIGKRVLTREEVELAPHAAEASSGTAPALGATTGPVARDAADAPAPSGTNWWPWAFGGLSVAAVATSVVAWERREHYAERWNDDDACLGVGVSRQQRCGADLERGQRAETVLWMSGAAAGLFAAGAVLSVFLSSPDESVQSGSVRCAPGVGGAACFGSF
jgi:hypothetical protein